MTSMSRRHRRPQRRTTGRQHAVGPAGPRAASPAGPAGWSRSVVAVLCLLWLIPTIGLLITSFRTARATPTAAAGGRCSPARSRRPSGRCRTTTRCCSGADPDGRSRSSTASRSALPATFIPILIAAFAAYAFTFMEFWGRDVAVPRHRGPARGAQLRRVRAAAEALRQRRPERHLPRGLAGAHRLRHAAGDLHPAQLHGDPAQGDHRVGQDRRRQPLTRRSGG